MTYPLSTPVSAGQPTNAAHYNNLRNDALYLGSSAANAVDLAKLLSAYETGVDLELLAANRVRCLGSPAAPVRIMINGIPSSSEANIDVSTGGGPSGAAAAWYIHARPDTAGSFTIEMSTAASVGGCRQIGSCYWDGSTILSDTIRSTYATWLQSLIKYNPPVVAQGRLSTTTGDVVPYGDTASSIIYYVPYDGTKISLYDASLGWQTYEFAELSLANACPDDDTNYDVFVHSNNGVLALSTTAWTSDSTRSTALVSTDGALLKSGALNYRYLGTIRAAGGSVKDSSIHRFVWNAHNRLPRTLKKVDVTASWTVNCNLAWSLLNADAANQVAVVSGLAREAVSLTALSAVLASSSHYAMVGIGLDATDANSADVSTMAGAGTSRQGLHARMDRVLPAGYHTLNLLQWTTNANATFYGVGSVAYTMQTGLSGFTFA